jgi:hypothetical protein
MSCGCYNNDLPLVNCNSCPDCAPLPIIPLPPCVGGEPCEEILGVECSGYTGPNLPAFGILNQDRLLTMLLKMHKVINPLLATPVPITSYTATSTTTTPMVVSYLGLGPVYTSTPGATNSSATITVGSTTGLAVGMGVTISAGLGAFASNTTITGITNPTTFTVSAVPTTPLSGGGSVVRAVGSNHEIFTISVVQGTPKTFQAFATSPVKLSGTGTIV